MSERLDGPVTVINTRRLEQCTVRSRRPCDCLSVATLNVAVMAENKGLADGHAELQSVHNDPVVYAHSERGRHTPVIY